MPWDFLKPSDLAGAGAVPGDLPNGTRVARLGTVSFVRSGFARVRWDDGLVTDEWVPDLEVQNP